MKNLPKNLRDFEAFKLVVQSLRDPKTGCPWDLEQTHTSLCQYAIEETYELVEAIELGDKKLMKEELGDILLQVLLHSEIASQNNDFDIYDVIEEISQKMIRRHPHVFSNTAVSSKEEVISNWEAIKNKEKKTRKQFDLPPALPALSLANKIGSKSKKYGFDWDTSEQVWEKVKEETREVEQALSNKNKEEIEDEIGDLLFSTAQLARHKGIDPEQALRKSNKKFLKRFSKMQEICSSKGLNWETLNLEEKEELWQETKKATS